VSPGEAEREAATLGIHVVPLGDHDECPTDGMAFEAVAMAGETGGS
jgi:hypothetical protein